MIGELTHRPEFIELLEARHCKRAFIDRAVSRGIVEDVLTAASNAPSSKNGQPWGVSVVAGAARDELSRLLCTDHDGNIAEGADYRYSPEPALEDQKVRARQVGYALYALKGIELKDIEARRRHYRENFEFFGAPLVLVFHLPAQAEKGNFLDMGFFMQNVMLGFLAYGIATCPQVSLTHYSDTVRRYLGLASERVIVSGMAVGYLDVTSEVNAFAPPRASIAEFVKWYT